jgi:uncharacterized membrane protein
MDIRDELVIAAPVERVWDLTLDVEQWPSLTPTMTSVERLDDGPIRVGSTAKVVQPRQRPTTWTVTRLEPRSLFEWQTKVGPVTMTAVHQLTATNEGCANTLVVKLSGVGSGLLSRLVGSKIRQAIATENAGFKAAAEQALDTSS